jgi:nucleotide-binding universal stress UspA family protein
MMYRRILMPLDGSPGSAQATAWGLRFAHKVGAEVTFLHVLENPLLGAYALPGGARYSTELLPALQRGVAEMLAAAQARAQKLGVSAEVLTLEEGHPAQAIAEREGDYDLTVMATHSRRGLDRLFIGSVTEGVLRRAQRPLLVLRCPDEEPTPPEAEPTRLPLEHFVLPLDGSPCSDVAVAEGLALARAVGARVTLLHALEVPLSVYTMPESMVYDPRLQEELRDAARAALAKAEAQAEAAGVAATTELVEGVGVRAVDAILKAEKGADLGVLGTHGRRGLNRLMLGSVAEGVIRQSALPHLVVRCPEQADQG